MFRTVVLAAQLLWQRIPLAHWLLLLGVVLLLVVKLLLLWCWVYWGGLLRHELLDLRHVLLLRHLLRLRRWLVHQLWLLREGLLRLEIPRRVLLLLCVLYKYRVMRFSNRIIIL